MKQKEETTWMTILKSLKVFLVLNSTKNTQLQQFPKRKLNIPIVPHYSKSFKKNN
jgi:hypothetical protein